MKIAVFRALYLGDILCSIPAIKLLKTLYPESELHYIGLPQMKDFVLRFPYIDRYIVFPGYEGLPEQPFDEVLFQKFVHDMQSENYDLVLQLHGNGTIVNDILQKFEAKRLIGFCPNSSEENENFCLYPNGIHEINRHLKVIQKLDLDKDLIDVNIDYPIFDQDVQGFEKLKLQYSLKDYVIFHVGAKSEKRRWPLENFKLLADYLLKSRYQIILTGTSGEKELVDNFNALIENKGINLAGVTDYGTIGLLIKNAKILVSNCTGVSHIAAAFATKSIIISLDGEPERWGPLNYNVHLTTNGLRELSIAKIIKDMDMLLGHTHAE